MLAEVDDKAGRGNEIGVLAAGGGAGRETLRFPEAPGHEEFISVVLSFHPIQSRVNQPDGLQ